MGKLFEEATKQHSLFYAWRRIRENGLSSSQEETRWATEQFDRQADKNIRRIQTQLRADKFEFDPQTGVAKPKASGNGKRGIVMASINNRVVERALLDTLQTKIQFVRSVITMPTSIGGVPERSVPHGLKIIHDAMSEGYDHFVRSDISGFFDNIARRDVLNRIAQETDDERFLALLGRASTVTLANETALGDDRTIFPTGDEGVAQGSPLSPLFGNILLHAFDLQFNRDGIICVRFIDDFVLLSKERRRVEKAFKSACSHLSALDLRCHDPYVNPDPAKAQFGSTEEGFVFLGYDVRPGLMQPSKKARGALIQSVRDRIRVGMREISGIIREAHADNTQRYSQTMVGIDRAVRGWGNAFAYGNSTATIDDLDTRIETELNKFRNWYKEFTRNDDWRAKRRTGGVCLLSDIKPKDLSDVPFKLAPEGRFVRSSKTITISTDGSMTAGRKRGRDKGSGGWAYLIHETNIEGSGCANEVTNNQMELQAVIEALKAAPKNASIVIRTDSQYVHQIAEGKNLAKSNGILWREYQDLTKGRKVKLVWVKGHAGDPHNERVDVLAKQRALEAAAKQEAA